MSVVAISVCDALVSPPEEWATTRLFPRVGPRKSGGGARGRVRELSGPGLPDSDSGRKSKTRVGLGRAGDIQSATAGRPGARGVPGSAAPGLHRGLTEVRSSLILRLRATRGRKFSTFLYPSGKQSQAPAKRLPAQPPKTLF